jgi:hypothetical protein
MSIKRRARISEPTAIVFDPHTACLTDRLWLVYASLVGLLKNLIAGDSKISEATPRGAGRHVGDEAIESAATHLSLFQSPVVLKIYSPQVNL